MTDVQPAQFDWATELSDAQGHVTLSKQEAKEIGARLRSMSAKLKAYEDLGDAADDVQLLRMGYAAARLEIESLKARLAERASHGQAPAQAAPAAVAGATDDELDELRQANSGRLNFVTFREFRVIARAVLAKWGAPAPVGVEPLSDDRIAEMMRDTWGCASIAPRHAAPFARAVEAEVHKLYQAPQPMAREAIDAADAWLEGN